jgi:hypothetical protein
MESVLTRAAGYPQGIVNLAAGYDPGSFDFYVAERTRNLAQSIAAGVDLKVSYRFQGSWGQWTFGLTETMYWSSTSWLRTSRL